MIAVQPTLLLLFVLPPPSAGTLGVAARYRASARRAANRREAPVMQNVVGNAVLTDERKHLLARPVEQRIYLDELVVWIDCCSADAGALVRLIRTQTRDPCGGAPEGALKRLNFAYRAARAPCR